MREKLTHAQTLQLHDVIELGGDLLLLPDESGIPHEEARALQVAGVIPVGESLLFHQTYQIFELQHRYSMERVMARGKEPEWVKEYPMSVQARLRSWYASTEEDAYAIMNWYPYVGIRYMVRDDGLCAHAARAFGLERLRGIKQLGFLQAPWVRQDIDFYVPLSESTRYAHSIDVMAIATLIGHNIGLEGSMFNTLRVAALTHDVQTPAGGDSVKLVDLPALDEDLNYEKKLVTVEWDLLSPYNIDRKLLLETVQNQGLLGEILDIADKLAYVARDIHTCLYHIEHGAAGDDQLGLRSLKRLIDKHQYVCSIWDSVIERDGHPVLTDPLRLNAFLQTRVLLFRELYYHPNSRFGEFLMSRILVKAMYKKGVLTVEKLLRMTDWQLHDAMAREYNLTMYGMGNALNVSAARLSRCASFTTRSEADAFIAKLRSEGNVFSLLEDNLRAIKTGSHFFVDTKSGPKPFKDAFPAETQILDEMARLLPMVHVYYLAGDPEIPREELERLKLELSE